MNEFTRYASAEERRIVRRLVAAMLRAGYSVSVCDGEAWPLKRSRDESAILDALASTESDTLRMRDAAGAAVGSVVLIWGNGCDILSDWSDNAATAEVIAATESPFGIR